MGSDPLQGHWGDAGFFPQSTGYLDVGSSLQFNSASNGELWLGFNDDAVSENVGDNSGSVTAVITTVPEPASGLLALLGGAVLLAASSRARKPQSEATSPSPLLAAEVLLQQPASDDTSARARVVELEPLVNLNNQVSVGASGKNSFTIFVPWFLVVIVNHAPPPAVEIDQTRQFPYTNVASIPSMLFFSRVFR